MVGKLGRTRRPFVDGGIRHGYDQPGREAAPVRQADESGSSHPSTMIIIVFPGWPVACFRRFPLPSRWIEVGPLCPHAANL